MGKRKYSNELILEILDFLKLHTYTETSLKYGVQKYMILEWKYPHKIKNRNKKSKEYMSNKLKDPLFKSQFLDKIYTKYRTDPVYKSMRLKRTSDAMKIGRQTNPIYKDTYLRNLRKRRARKLSVTENYTSIDESYTRSLFNNECAICKTKEKLEIDHWYPLSKGYALSRTNAVLLCRTCNAHKHNHLPNTFYDIDTYNRISMIIHNPELNRHMETAESHPVLN